MIKAALKKDTVSGALRELIKAGTDLKPLMATLGQTGVQRMKMGFKAGRSPEGSAWKALKVRNGQPLRDTGRLMNSISSFPTNDQVEIGTNVFYGAVHQFGATINPSDTPHGTIAGVSSKGAGFLAFKVPGGWAYTRKSIEIPARPFVPESKIPKAWQDAFLRNTKAHIKAHLSKAK